jgi:hypothetical protein
MAFETIFLAMVTVLARSIDGKGRCRQAKAEAISALCVGGMVVARALAHREVADQLRKGCMAVALELGGWGAPRGRRQASKSAARRKSANH